MATANRRRFVLRHLSRWHSFGLKRSLWRFGTVIASTSVVTFALLYVVEPTSSAMTLRGRVGGDAPPGSVVLYGSVLNGKSPIQGAQITVTESSSGKTRGYGTAGKGKTVGSESTDDEGTYRLQLFVGPGEYTVDISLANGTRKGHFEFQLPGNSADSGNTQGNSVHGSDAETTGFLSYGRSAPIEHHGSSGSLQGSRGEGSGGQGSAGTGGLSTDGSSSGGHFALLSADQVLSLSPGMAYDVSAQVTTTNFLSFLPVSSY
jgi:hypothetical protein